MNFFVLQQVITNEHVVAMVKNTLMADKEKFEAHYEPKMTRSKVKHIIQEEGDVSTVIYILSFSGTCIV